MTVAALVSTRVVVAVVPVSVSYELTPTGLALMPALEQVAPWSQMYLTGE